MGVIEWGSRGGRGLGGVGSVVVDGSEGNGLLGDTAGFADSGAHENRGTFGQFGLDDDIGTLPNLCK